MGHLRGEALLLNRRDRVAAADDDGRPSLGPFGQEAGHFPGAMTEGRDLEHSQRPIPEDRSGRCERLLHERQAVLAQVDDMPGSRDLLGRERLVLGPLSDLLGHDHVGRQDDPDALFLGQSQDAPGVLHPVVLGQALAHRFALGDQERVGHAAPHDEQVDRAHEVFQYPDLARHLGAADDGCKRPLRLLEQVRKCLDLGLHEQARVGRQEGRDAHGRGMGAVGRPEGVVHVDVAIRGQCPGKGRIVLLLGSVEAQVLQD